MNIEFIERDCQETLGKTIDQLENYDEYSDVLCWAGRNAGPALLIRWFPRLVDRPDVFPRLLLDVWSGVEFPTVHFGTKLWVMIFRRAGFITDTGQPAPSNALTVYRGCTSGRVRHPSWTKDFELARWFAARPFGRHAYVYRAQIPRDGVLAIIENHRTGSKEDDRRETEVVVDPAMLVRPSRIAA